MTLVDAPCLTRTEQFGWILFAIHHESHLVDRAVIGKWKNEGHFHLTTAGVDKRLRDLHLRNLIAHRGVHSKFLDLVRLRRLWLWPGMRDRMGPNVRTRKPETMVRAVVDQQSLATGQC